ncbi:unnamed protein product [Laminaria digitata]
MMREPRTLALLYLVAAATTAVVSGFHTCGIARGRSTRWQPQKSSRRQVSAREWRQGDSSSSGSSGRVGHSLWRAPTVRCAPLPAGDDNYGSSDYSEFGYEPEYEMKSEDPPEDEEMLEQWRLERLLVNDRWQFGMYGKQNVGTWMGRWKEYVTRKHSAGATDPFGFGVMMGVEAGGQGVANTRITRRVLQYANDSKMFEHQQETVREEGAGEYSCPEPVVEALFSDSFRGGNGTQVVGNTYTTAEERPSEAGSGITEVWVEVGLRVKDIRVRCIFQYDRDESGAAAFKRMFLVREGLDRLPLDDGETEPELYGFAGTGLYSAPPQSMDPLYFSIYAEGGLTIRFPMKVFNGKDGVFSVDWTAGNMRYQADRVFDLLDGSCRRLEVTEIGTEDAQTFLPMERF